MPKTPPLRAMMNRTRIQQATAITRAKAPVPTEVIREARSRIRSGEFAEAEALMADQEGVANDYRAQMTMGSLRVVQQEYSASLKHYARAHQLLDHARASVHSNEAISLVALKQYATARDKARAALKLVPSKGNAWINLLGATVDAPDEVGVVIGELNALWPVWSADKEFCFDLIHDVTLAHVRHHPAAAELTRLATQTTRS